MSTAPNPAPADPTTDATARIALAAELATLKAELRRERALRAHPALEHDDLVDLVAGEDDASYAASAARLAAIVAAARR